MWEHHPQKGIVSHEHTIQARLLQLDVAHSPVSVCARQTGSERQLATNRKEAKGCAIRHRIRRLRGLSFRPRFERISDPQIPPTRLKERSTRKLRTKDAR